MRNHVKEENAIVLDFLRHGYSEDRRPLHRKEPIIQVLGINHFVLLELVANSDLSLKPYDKVYVGDGKREQVKYIKGTLDPNKLTTTARTELPFIIKTLVKEKEEKFVEFFNKAGPISLRSHQLELLPKIGKKHTRALIEAREEKPFESFQDIRERVSSVQDPVDIVTQRIIEEIEEKDRYRLFVRT